MHSQNKLKQHAKDQLRKHLELSPTDKLVGDILSVTNVADISSTPVYIVCFELYKGRDNSEYAIARIEGSRYDLLYRESLPN